MTLHTSVRFPARVVSPALAIVRRLLVALGLVAFTAALVYADRDGYSDALDGNVSALDAFYYATVSVTTTGYGDITPVSDGARLVSAVVVTPLRVLFLILLVGTTIEVLTEQSRVALRVRGWRRRLRGHVIVCGFGAKGQAAAEAVVRGGTATGDVVVVDLSPAAVEEANREGFVAVLGDASRTGVLEEAKIRTARAVVVAPDDDSTAVLVTLTARELNQGAAIAVAVRKEENTHLVRQSGATSVISAGATPGRLLGLATHNPAVIEVLDDLLEVGRGLEVRERPVDEEELGGPPRFQSGELVLAVVRDDRVLRFNDPGISRLQRGDRVMVVCAHGG